LPLEVPIPGKPRPTELVRVIGAYPNPFRESVRIRYRVARPTQVTLAVHDLMGRLCARLVEDRRDAGDHEVEWDGTTTDGRHLPRGLYFVGSETGGSAPAMKVLILSGARGRRPR
jgi:hypothetical protein